MTRNEIIERLKMAPNGDQHKLLALMDDEGILVSRKRARLFGQTGPCPTEYSVAREWRDA